MQPLRAFRALLFRRPRRQRKLRARLLEPVRFGIRRLEERRVLDVSAAFLSATGELQIAITGAGGSAELTSAAGQLEIRDEAGAAVDVDIDGAGVGQISLTDVERLEVRGDSFAAQRFTLNTLLLPENGLLVDSNIETAVLAAPVTFVTAGDIVLDAAEVELASNLNAPGRDIRIGGHARLASDVRLTSQNVTFAATLNDDGLASTSSQLSLRASGVTALLGDVGQLAPLDSLTTDAPGQVWLSSQVHADGVTFRDSVLLVGDSTVRADGAAGLLFADAIDSQGDHAFDLTLSAVGGSIELWGAIGGGTAGDQRLGDFTVEHAVGGIQIGDGHGADEIRTAGSLNIGTHVSGVGVSSAEFRGAVQYLVNSEGPIRINAPTKLASDLSITAIGDGVTFTRNAPIDSANNTTHRLQIDAGQGGVFFYGSIGSATPLSGLHVDRADAGVTVGDDRPTGDLGRVKEIRATGPIMFGVNAEIGGSGLHFDAGDADLLVLSTTSDEVVLNGAVTLASGLHIDTGSGSGSIVFTSAATIDSGNEQARDLVLNAGAGAVRLYADIGATSPLGMLSVTRADAGIVVGGAASLGQGMAPVRVVQTEAGIDFGVGDNAVGGVGIVIEGGLTGTSLVSDGGDIRLNGALTLRTGLVVSTGSEGGDITFTNDTPVDSLPGRASDLSLNAGQGRVHLNEDLGGSHPLGTFIVEAAAGVITGRSVIEVPGSGSTGPVDLIRAASISVGSMELPIGGEGIAIAGGAITGMRLEAAGGSVLLNGPTRLYSDLSISTGDGRGDILLGQNTTIDSAADRPYDLRLDGGGGRVLVSADIGATNALGVFTVTQAGRGLVLGAESGVSSIRAGNGIDLGAENPIGSGGGIVIQQSSDELHLATDGGDIRINGRLTLATDLAASTRGGSVVFTDQTPIDAASDAGATSQLTVDAEVGNVQFGASVGSAEPIDGLTVVRSAGGIAIGTPAVAIPTQVVVHTRGPLVLGAGDLPEHVIAGGIHFDGGSNPLDVLTEGADIRLNGPVRLASDLRFATGGGNIELTEHASVNGAEADQSSWQLEGGSGFILVAAPVGELAALREMRIVSVGDFTARDAIHATRLVQESGSGTTAFRGAVHTRHPDEPGIEITGRNVVFDGPVRATGNGQVAVAHSGQLTVAPGARLELDGAFVESGTGVVELGGDIMTAAGTIQFSSPVMVRAEEGNSIELATTLAAEQGADIEFRAALDGSTSNAPLSLDAGDANDVRFLADVGVQHAPTITVERARDVLASGQFIADRFHQSMGTGATRFESTVTVLGGPGSALSLKTEDIFFNGPTVATGGGDVELTVAGSLAIEEDVRVDGGGSFAQRGGAAVLLSGNVSTDGGSIQVEGPLRIATDARIATGAGGGDIQFNGTVDAEVDTAAPVSLALFSGGGSLSFREALGESTEFASIRIESAGDAEFQAAVRTGSFSQLQGTGLTRFANALTTASFEPLLLDTGSVVMEGQVDTTAGNAALRITAAEQVVMEASVRTGAGNVTIVAGGGVTLRESSSVITDDAAISIDAGSLFMEDGSLIQSGSASVALAATNNITLGQLITESTVHVDSRSGTVHDGGDQGGADIQAAGLAIAASGGVGTADPLETAVSELAARVLGAGGLRINNVSDTPLTVGTVGQLTGIHSGPDDSGLDADGAIQLTNRGSLHVVSPIRNHSGGDTELRAEFPGDLVLDAPVQNRGGDGWVVLFAGGDLVVNDSVPEFTATGAPVATAEISVEYDGAVRGIARGGVTVEDGPEGFAIIRTHAERFPTSEPPLEIVVPDPSVDPSGFEQALRAIRASVAPQFVNVPPLLSVSAVDQGGSTIDSLGRAQLRIEIGNPQDLALLERNFQLIVDWGDGTTEQFPIPGAIDSASAFVSRDGRSLRLLPDATSAGRFDSGVETNDGRIRPVVYFAHHVYTRNPNPTNPADPIIVRAELRYDPRSEGELSFEGTRPLAADERLNGVRFFENLTEEIFSFDTAGFRAPGIGLELFLKVVESRIEPIELGRSAAPFIPPTSTTIVSATSEPPEFTSVQFEEETSEEYRLFLRVVDGVTGEELAREYELPLEHLDDPIGLFTTRVRFPDGQYRVYLEELRTQRARLILEVHIYEGRVVPPNYREGAGERQPGAIPEAAEVPAEQDARPLQANDDQQTEHRSRAGMVVASAGVAEAVRTLQIRSILRHSKKKLNQVARISRRLRRRISRDSDRRIEDEYSFSLRD